MTRSKKRTDHAWPVNGSTQRKALGLSVHGPFVEEHFHRGHGRLGVSVVLMPDIALDDRSALGVRCLWLAADDESFRAMCGQEWAFDLDAVIDTLDPATDMLLYLVRQSASHPNMFESDTLLLIRNARDEHSVPEPLFERDVVDDDIP
jgi:hypothetical protein